MTDPPDIIRPNGIGASRAARDLAATLAEHGCILVRRPYGKGWVVLRGSDQHGEHIATLPTLKAAALLALALEHFVVSTNGWGFNRTGPGAPEP